MTCTGDELGTCCGLCDYKPTVVMATHNRIEITEENIRLLRKQNCEIVLVVSDHREVLHFAGKVDRIAKHPNKPLGDKWQHGVNLCRSANPLIILGSDDIVSHDFISNAVKLVNEGNDFVGFTRWYVFDQIKDILYDARYTGKNTNLTIGSGRIYSKKFLDKIKHHLFKQSLDKKLDDFGFHQVRKYANKIKIISEPEILSVKGDWSQMNPLIKFHFSPNIEMTEVDKSIIEKKFGYVRDSGECGIRTQHNREGGTPSVQ